MGGGATRERGRPARMLSRCVPLSFPAMRHPATLPAGTAWARPKHNIVTNSNGVYLRPVQSITVFIIIGLCEFRRRLTGLQHPLKSTVIPYIIRG